jgi:hypothetical protein
VTGVAGDRRERVEVEENTIRRIEISEVADRPCEFWFRNNRVGTYVYTPSVRGNNCSDSSVQLAVDLGEDAHRRGVSGSDARPRTGRSSPRPPARRSPPRPPPP